MNEATDALAIETAVAPQDVAEATVPASTPSPHKEPEGAYTEVTPSAPQSVANQEELNAVIQAHTDWKESVLHPRRKIQGGRANLSGANLTGLSLVGVDLSGATLAQANMENANLSSVNLSAANLEGANLRGATLSGAKLTNARLNGATFINIVADDSLREHLSSLGFRLTEELAQEEDAQIGSAEEVEPTESV